MDWNPPKAHTFSNLAKVVGMVMLMKKEEKFQVPSLSLF